MAKGLLAAGTMKAGELTYLYIDPDAIVALYVTEGEYVHPGKCLDTFLRTQYEHTYEAYNVMSNEQLEQAWDDIVEVGAWTVEWGNVDEAQEYDPNFDPFTTPCLTCGKLLL